MPIKRSVLARLFVAHVLLATVGFCETARAEEAFSMADLEALDKQEAWQELLLHASDVPPSKRTDRWGQIVERAALGVLASHAGAVDRAWTFADAVVRQYPQLKKSKRFMAERAQAGVRGLEDCLRAKDITPCSDRAVMFVEADPSDADTGFALARMIARRVPGLAVRVYKRALTARHTAKDCADELLGRAVGDALGHAPESSLVAEARTVASDLCWDGVKGEVIDRFIANERNVRRNACPFLLAKKDALSPMSKRQCESLKP